MFIKFSSPRGLRKRKSHREREEVGGGERRIALIAEERGFGKRRKMMWYMGMAGGFLV